MDMPLEIERRFLIRRPDPVLLEDLCTQRWDITQTYLRQEEDAPGARLRLRREGDRVLYLRTEKTRMTDMTRVEVEWELTQAEYKAQLEQADPALRQIRKRRYRVPFQGKLLELDFFPFWDDRALLEIELQSEDEHFTLPDWLTVIREVTADRRYTNRALAAAVPQEAI